MYNKVIALWISHIKIKMSLFIYIICISCGQVISNYTFYEVTAFSNNERDLLFYMQESQTYKYAHFLNGITNEASTPMDVVVDSCCTEDFKETLFKYDIEFSSDGILVPYLLDYESTGEIKPNVFRSFLDYNDILEWVENKTNHTSVLTKTVIAKTSEHRDIFVLKLSNDRSEKKNSVFIVAGEEGRDWLSSAVLLSYINNILDTASSSQSILNEYDIYCVPILNPDGFVYTKTKDRMWAKNRKIIHSTKICEDGKPAVGINLDRNWFDENSVVKSACNSIYPGSKALSEEETQGLSYMLNSIALELLAFINLRGFANLITVPYAYNTEMSSNNKIVMEIMKHTSAVLKIQYNKSYPVGTTSSYFYNFTGNMPDWVKNKLNIPVVFTVYMQENSFLPEESDILPLAEHLDALLNISLVLSQNMYGSLYNNQTKETSLVILIIISFICILSLL